MIYCAAPCERREKRPGKQRRQDDSGDILCVGCSIQSWFFPFLYHVSFTRKRGWRIPRRFSPYHLCDGLINSSSSQHKHHSCNTFIFLIKRKFFLFGLYNCLTLLAVRIPGKEFRKTVLHWPIVILQPTVLWQNKTANRRIAALLQNT